MPVWMQNAWSINAVLNKRPTKGRQPLQLLLGDFGFMDAENNSAVKEDLSYQISYTKSIVEVRIIVKALLFESSRFQRTSI